MNIVRNSCGYYLIYCISGELQQYIPYGDRFEIITLERFIMKANTGEL